MSIPIYSSGFSAPNTPGVLAPVVQTGADGANHIGALPLSTGTGVSATNTGTAVSLSLNNSGQSQVGGGVNGLLPVVLQTDVSVTAAYAGTVSPAYSATTPVLSYTLNPTVTGAPIHVRFSCCASTSATAPSNAVSGCMVFAYYSIGGSTPVLLGQTGRDTPAISSTPTIKNLSHLYIDCVANGVSVYGSPITIYIGATKTLASTANMVIYSQASTNALNGLSPATLFIDELISGTAGVVGYSYKGTSSVQALTGTLSSTSVPVTLNSVNVVNSVAYTKIYPNTLLKACAQSMTQGSYSQGFQQTLFAAVTGTVPTAVSAAVVAYCDSYFNASSSTSTSPFYGLNSVYAFSGLAPAAYAVATGIQVGTGGGGPGSGSTNCQRTRLFVYETNPYVASGTINLNATVQGWINSYVGTTTTVLSLGIQPYASTTALTSFPVRNYGSSSFIEIDLVINTYMSNTGSCIVYFYTSNNLLCPVYALPLVSPANNATGRATFWVPSQGAGTSQTIYVGAAVTAIQVVGGSANFYFSGCWEEKDAVGGYAPNNNQQVIVSQNTQTGVLTAGVTNQLNFTGVSTYSMPSAGQMQQGSVTKVNAVNGTYVLTCGTGQQFFYQGQTGSTLTQTSTGCEVTITQLAQTGTQTTGYLYISTSQGIVTVN